MNVLVIDVGTSSMRGVLFDEKGNSLLKRQVKYHSKRLSGMWIEQPAEEFYQALLDITIWIGAQAAGQMLDVVAVTGQRSSVIPVDAGKNALMPAIMWQDSRNARIAERLAHVNDTIFQSSGAGVNTVFSGSKMTWIKEECPEIYQKAHKLVNIPEYLICRMTGEFDTDHTYGSRSNLMNIRSRNWDSELLDIFGIGADKLCALNQPGSILGRITPIFARESGLKAGTLVVSAGGDQQCAAIGQGVFREGTLSIVTGTGAFLVSSCEKLPEVLDPRLIYNCSSVQDSYILEASVLTCCSAFDWFCDNFYDEAGRYDRIDQELEQLYETEVECMVLPYFQGRSSSGWDSTAKALFANITLSASRGELLKALVEGILLEIQNNVELFRQYVDVSQAYISGGLTNSRIIDQMQADIYGIPLHHPENSESTALGALMVTLTGLGVYETIAEAFEQVRGQDPKEIYYPNPEKTKQYQEKRMQMNKLYETVYSQNRGED